MKVHRILSSFLIMLTYTEAKISGIFLRCKIEINEGEK